MVWAGAWFGPTLHTVYHQLVVGGGGVKTGTGFPARETRGFDSWAAEDERCSG